MRYLIFILSMTVLFASCTSPTKRAEKVVKEWLGREIIFPDDMAFTIQGDTVDYDWMNSDFKIVNIIDSVGCSECKMRFPMWQYMIEHYNSDISADLSVIFIMSENNKKIDRLFKIYESSIPVVFDSERNMERLNQLKDLTELRTFLLDSNNRITNVS